MILTPVEVTIDNLQDTVLKDNGDLGRLLPDRAGRLHGEVRPGLQGGRPGVDRKPNK